MIIRLTTPELFDKVLEKLKQHQSYNEEVNASFFKYCYVDIWEGIAKGDDEYYLDVDWNVDPALCKVVMTIRYYKRSGIPTDVEYLKEEQ